MRAFTLHADETWHVVLAANAFRSDSVLCCLPKQIEANQTKITRYYKKFAGYSVRKITKTIHHIQTLSVCMCVKSHSIKLPAVDVKWSMCFLANREIKKTDRKNADYSHHLIN